MATDNIIALQDRVYELESQLEIARSTVNSPIGIPPTSAAQHDRHATANGIRGGSLTLEPSGALRFVGPTSTFFRTSPADLKFSRKPIQIASSTYLPISIDFFLHNLIVDRAFLHLNWAEIVIEEEFRQGLMRSSPIRTNHFSPFIHLVVLAIGCRYLSQEEAARICPNLSSFEVRGDIFAAVASGMIEAECSDPNLGTIRGLLGLTGYKSGRGEE